MSLSILLLLVVGGIGSVVLAVHLLGFSQKRVLSGPDEAIAEWRREFPDSDPVDAVLSHKGTAAIIMTRQGQGLLWSLGADTTARWLRDFNTRPLAYGIQIAFHDITAPYVNLELDTDERQHWENMLDPL